MCMTTCNQWILLHAAILFVAVYLVVAFSNIFKEEWTYPSLVRKEHLKNSLTLDLVKISQGLKNSKLIQYSSIFSCLSDKNYTMFFSPSLRNSYFNGFHKKFLISKTKFVQDTKLIAIPERASREAKKGKFLWITQSTKTFKINQVLLHQFKNVDREPTDLQLVGWRHAQSDLKYR